MTVSIGSQQLSSSNSSKRIQPPKSSRIRNDKALMWLYENLLTHQLRTKLQCLLSDNEHLTNCYEVTLAFFGSKKFVDAFYICLNAYDNEMYDILLEIDQNLYLSVIKESLKNSETTSRMMNDNTSLSSNKKILNEKTEFCDNKCVSKFRKCDDLLRRNDDTSKSTDNKLQTAHKKCRNTRARCKIKHAISLKLRRFVSLPNLKQNSVADVRPVGRPRSQSMRTKMHRLKLTVENLAINDRQKVPCIQMKNRISKIPDRIQNRVDDLQPINLVKCDDIKIYTDRRADSSTSFSEFDVASKKVGLVKSGNLLPYLNTSHGSSNESSSPGKKLTSNSAPGDFASFFAANGSKIENRYKRSAIIDNIESSTSSPLCSHDQCALVPNRGQSLTSYLQEAQRIQRNITDLERENAHFSLSEAIISAIEEIKCSQMERKKEKKNKATSQAKKRKSQCRPLKNWDVGSNENCDKNVNTDDETSSYVSEDGQNMSRSSSESDLSHISSSSDSSTASNSGDLKRLKVNLK